MQKTRSSLLLALFVGVGMLLHAPAEVAHAGAGPRVPNVEPVLSITNPNPAPGEEVQISWDGTKNMSASSIYTKYCHLNASEGDDPNVNHFPSTVTGSAFIIPLRTTTYSVTCGYEGWDGANYVDVRGTSNPVTVTVSDDYAIQTLPTASLTVNPSSIDLGDGAPSHTYTISWSSSRLAGGSCVGDGFYTGGATSGSVSVNADTNSAPATYSVTCTNNIHLSASASASVSITLAPGSCYPDSDAVIPISQIGDSIRGYHTSSSSVTCSPSGSPCPHQCSGLGGVTPSVTVDTPMCCSGGGSLVFDSNNQAIGVRCTVSSTPSVVLTATPSTIVSGGTSKLTWRSSNVTSCTSSDFTTGGAASNSTGVSVSPTATKTYTISCTGSDAAHTTVTDSKTVTVSTELTASCSVSPDTAGVGANVTWSASAHNGTGSYTYEWSGTDSLTGSTASVTKAYTATGDKTGHVKVTSGTETKEVDCSNKVTITPAKPDLAPAGFGPHVVVASDSATTFTAKVNNTGTANAGVFTSTTYICEHDDAACQAGVTGTGGPAATLKGRILALVQPIAHAASYVTMPLTASTGPAAGSFVNQTGTHIFNIPDKVYDMILCVDRPANAIPESDDSAASNCGTWQTITVCPTGNTVQVVGGVETCVPSGAANLTASPVTPTAAVAGTAANFSATVTNGTAVPVASAFHNLFQRADAYDASTDTATNVQALGTADIASLAANAGKGVSLSYTFPAADGGTTRYMRVCADKSSAGDGGLIPETTNEDNCGAWTAITVGACTGSGCTPPGGLSCGTPTQWVDSATGNTVGQWSLSGTAPAPYTWTTSDSSQPASSACGKVTSSDTYNDCHFHGNPGDSFSVSVKASSGETVSCSPVTIRSACSGAAVSIDASPKRVKLDSTGHATVAINWSATGANNCTVTGPGLNVTPTPSSCTVPNTSQNVTITTQSTYKITCDGASKSVTVNVIPNIVEF